MCERLVLTSRKNCRILQVIRTRDACIQKREVKVLTGTNIEADMVDSKHFQK